MFLKALLILYTLSQISSVMFETDSSSKYCFRKSILRDKFIVSYSISSDSKMKMDATLKEVGPERIIFSQNNQERGNYESPLSEKAGTYELCFFPKLKKKAFISFEFRTQLENPTSSLVKDDDFKGTLKDIMVIKSKFRTMENNNRQLNDQRFSHFLLFKRIYGSIKFLNIIKFLIIVGMTVLQVMIIKRFFKEEKRTTKISVGDTL